MDVGNLDAQDTLARTAWGEAANMGVAGMTATLNTVVNRMKSGETWWGTNLPDICLFQSRGIHQYSCWNSNNRQLPKILSVTAGDVLFRVALELASRAIAGTLDDLTDGATHYFNHNITNPVPDWALDKTPLFVLEPHWYYRVI